MTVKRFSLFLVLTACFSFVSGQTNQWSWIQGDSIVPLYAVYGTQGVESPANTPGGRAYALRWRGADGSLWLYGGYGNTLTQRGYLGDLWKYTPASGRWTWMGGDTLTNAKTVYGTKGVTTPGNKPGLRARSGTWTDSAGNLWLFGDGGGITDFWMYSTTLNQWTWMGGDTITNQRPVYTTKGMASATGKPGSRPGAATWIDKFGNFWLFGGDTRGDTWKYSFTTAQWTWVSGDSATRVITAPGTLLVPAAGNRPSSRSGAVTWADSVGNLWLYGGYGSPASGDPSSVLSDVWRFTPADGYWTWMNGSPNPGGEVRYGTRGVPASGNQPGARMDATGCTDSDGNLWLFGTANNLWKFNPTTNLWAWFGGYPTLTQIGSNGTKGIPGPTNIPSAREGAVSWFDASGKLWIFGGSYSLTSTEEGPMNDLWQYAVADDQWTWASGDNNNSFRAGNYGTKGVAAPGNKPGKRIQSMSWTDSSGALWLFGGNGYGNLVFPPGKGELSDLWKWSPATGLWTWIQGDATTDQYASYGTRGVAANTNKPGARYGGTGWTDANGNLWMFGGTGRTNPLPIPMVGTFGSMNDLWKYEPATNLWTWISGNNIARQPGSYGTKGVAAAANIPRARYNAVSWKDTSGNYWLFGGFTDAVSGSGCLNDLWMYSPATSQWTWKSGDNTVDQTGIYGSKGIAASANKPGARQGAASWTDAAGNLWLFGGTTSISLNNYYNDLWMYSPATGQWTWMGGDNIPNQRGSYNMQGVAAASNKPTARRDPAVWTDKTGNFWMFGGSGYGNTVFIPGSNGVLNDLWTYSPRTLQWTWMGGDSIANRTGMYGTAGIPSTANNPGGRSQAIGWRDASGNLRLYSGNGLAINGPGDLNDFWVYTLPAATLPVQFSQFTARKQSASVLLSWTTAQEQNSREFIVERAADGTAYTRIGTVAASGTANTATSYTFTDAAPLAGNNFYRLKEVDLDEKSMYSSVQKVFFEEVAARLQVLVNPVQHMLQIQTQLPFAQQIDLEIRNAAGHLLIKKMITAGSGTIVSAIAVDKLPSGIYFVHARSKSLDNTRSFIKR